MPAETSDRSGERTDGQWVREDKRMPPGAGSVTILGATMYAAKMSGVTTIRRHRDGPPATRGQRPGREQQQDIGHTHGDRDEGPLRGSADQLRGGEEAGVGLDPGDRVGGRQGHDGEQQTDAEEQPADDVAYPQHDRRPEVAYSTAAKAVPRFG